MKFAPIKYLQSLTARLRGSSVSGNSGESYIDTLNSFGIEKVEMKARDKTERQASSGIVPDIISQRAVSLKEWQQAVDLARHPQMLNRRQLMLVYDNVMYDLHLDSVVDTRVLNAQGAARYLKDQNGDIDLGASALLKTEWFNCFLKEAIMSHFYGFSLLEFFEMGVPLQIQLNKKKLQVTPFKEAKLVNRMHVRPPLKRWYVNTFDDKDTGFGYSEPPYNNYYIGIGDPESLGKLLKIAPIVLAKRYAFAAWSEYDEKIGIPFRKVIMQGQNGGREKKLAEIMRNMGSAGWGIFHQGETVELLQAQGSDPHKCFLELINLIDAQVSKTVLGQTMTTDQGSSRSQAEVHQDTGNIRFKSDQEFIEHYVNTQLLPLLIARGYPLEGYTYEYDQSQQLDAQKQINVDQVLLQYFDLDPEYISNKYNIPINMIGPKLTPVIIAEPKVDPAKK